MANGIFAAFVSLLIVGSRRAHAQERKIMSTSISESINNLSIAYLSEPSYRHAFKEIIDRQDYRFTCDVIDPFIIDCGANIGLASLYFKALFPRSTILAFEPDPTTFAVLRQNVETNGVSSVHIYNVALWDKDGTLPFYVCAQKPGCLAMSIHKNRCEGEEIHVPCRRLSSFISKRVHLLKLDIEGSEYQVIEDLVHTGKIRLIDQMIIEYHHNIPGDNRFLGQFLLLLENAGWRYQLRASLTPLSQRDQFQDILLYAYCANGQVIS